MVTRAQTKKMVENKMKNKSIYGNPFSAGSGTVKKKTKNKYGAPKKKTKMPARKMGIAMPKK
jgi:hypothetical protein